MSRNAKVIRLSLIGVIVIGVIMLMMAIDMQSKSKTDAGGMYDLSQYPHLTTALSQTNTSVYVSISQTVTARAAE